jgi:mannose-1-phosphate guanylyltransferase/phosphomannomutase
MVEQIKTQIVIIAGGKGTRSATPSIPKSLQLVMGKKIISWQLEEISNQFRHLKKIQVQLVIGYQGHLIEKFVENNKNKYKNLEINILRDLNLDGTNSAFSLVPHLEYENSLVILGDIFFKSDLLKLINFHETKKSNLTLVSHPNTHPYDSDLVETNLNGEIIKFHSKNIIKDSHVGNNALAGIFLVRNSIVELRNPSVRDVIENLVQLCLSKHLSIYSWNTISTITDLGTIKRILDFEQSVMVKYPRRINKLKKGALFVDLDGTLIANTEIKNAITPPTLDKEIINCILRINRFKIPIIVITNQPGIAKGYFSELNFMDFRRNLEGQLSKHGAYIDDWIVCPHHPESGWKKEVKNLKVKCKCRKPEPGMFIEAAEKYEIKLKNSVYIGDTETDMLVAKKIGIRFIKVSLNKTKDLISTAEALDDLINIW